MEKSIDFYRKVLDSMYDGVYFVDRNRNIVYWNKGAERLTGYSENEVLGTSCSNNLLMHVDDRGNSLCQGFCPLAKTIADGSIRENEVFLLHKAGHRVPVSVRTIPYQDEMGRIIGAVEIFSDSSMQRMQNEKMKELARLAFSDELTGLANSRYTEMKLCTLIEEVKKGGPLFGVLLIDIEIYRGNARASDSKEREEVMKIVAKTLTGSLQLTDIASYWEKDRFLIISTNSRRSLLLLLADKLRTLLIQSGFASIGENVRVSPSISGTMVKIGDTSEGMLERVLAIIGKRGNENGNSSVVIDGE